MKRVFDLVLATVALLLLVFPMLCLIWLVRKSLAAQCSFSRPALACMAGLSRW